MLELSQRQAAYLAIATRDHCRALRRDGIEPPADLTALADRLREAIRDESVTPGDRARRFARERQRRSRARRRGELVPLRRSGRPPAGARQVTRAS